MCEPGLLKVTAPWVPKGVGTAQLGRWAYPESVCEWFPASPTPDAEFAALGVACAEIEGRAWQYREDDSLRPPRR